jgi:hypothetical protein
MSTLKNCKMCDVSRMNVKYKAEPIHDEFMVKLEQHYSLTSNVAIFLGQRVVCICSEENE